MIPADYRPSSGCPHDGPIAAGRRAYCVVCHACGLDGSPGLEVDPRTAPWPERRAPDPATAAKSGTPRAETEKQRKARLRAEALERLRWLL